MALLWYHLIALFSKSLLVLLIQTLKIKGEFQLFVMKAILVILNTEHTTIMSKWQIFS